jgi:hypothetical protein
VVYVLIFTMLESCLLIDGSSFFVRANGNEAMFSQMQSVAGALASSLDSWAITHVPITCANKLCLSDFPWGSSRSGGEITRGESEGTRLGDRSA